MPGWQNTYGESCPKITINSNSHVRIYHGLCASSGGHMD